jgi:putative transposase
VIVRNELGGAWRSPEKIKLPRGACYNRGVKIPLARHRKYLRLQGYDYSQAGGYFVTIVTQGRECLFGEIVGGEMRLNPYGEIVTEEWLRSAEIRREIRLDAFCVMPNHIHGIVFIYDDPVGATGRSPQPTRDRYPHGPAPKSLGAFMAGFKSSVTKRINVLENTPGAPVWQRNYYEHIIRDEQDYERIFNYIANNPSNWPEDEENR